MTPSEDQPLTLINLTPHEVVLRYAPGRCLRVPAAGRVPRLLLGDGELRSLRLRDPEDPQQVHEVPLVVGDRLLGIDPPLPAPREGTLYVTSRVVAQRYPERADLVWPDDLVRDDAGQVVGARRLACAGSRPTTDAGQEGRPTDGVGQDERPVDGVGQDERPVDGVGRGEWDVRD